MANTLKFGFPAGSLSEATVQLFARAGWQIRVSSRSYKPSVDDAELEGRFVRAQEVSRYVESGYFDCGITGKDWIAENESKIEVVCDLPYSKATSAPARWVLAVPEASPIKTVKDLEGKRIATEAVSITRQFLARHGVQAHVEFSWGATEVKVPDLVDAIVDITETGSSLKANKLRIVDTLMESYPQLIVNPTAWGDPWKKQKIQRIALLLKGALEARQKVGLKMNIQEPQLKRLIDSLPALRNPTISKLSTEGWVAVETIIDEHVVRELIPQLKELGAEGIIEYPLNKVIY
ncbi:ATP phosphoribosyltransferase [Kamptonema cortianum]|nr:ATP phosphoribosyltransferase [Kamptonema cortianum]MDL5046195.1 ATP phosphoribosyltransferase [Oscillatoria amoena NRMC-F 0135]